MIYIILNDGETFTDLRGCAIYDSRNGKLYSIRKRRDISINKDIDNSRWRKGIASIKEIESNVDDAVPGM